MIDETRFTRARRRRRGDRRPAARRRTHEDLDLAEALRAAVVRARRVPTARSPPTDLEVAVLARGNGRRKFRRLEGPQLDDLMIVPGS